MKLTIIRSRWLRGNPHSSFLRDSLGRQCCMGFLASACGIDSRSLEGQSYFSELEEDEWAKLPEKLRPIPATDSTETHRRMLDTTLAQGIYKKNDSYAITHEQREEDLTILLKNVGIEVTFAD